MGFLRWNLSISIKVKLAGIDILVTFFHLESVHNLKAILIVKLK